MIRFDPIALLGILLIFFLAYCFLPKAIFFDPTSGLLLPSLRFIKNRSKTFLEQYAFFPKWLYFAGLFSLLVAFIDPHLEVQDKMSDLPPHEGLAFYLLLDRSGSMGKIVDHVTRFDRLQSAAIGLIQSFPNDLIGVITFARAAEVISPMTLDHKLLEKRIRDLGVIKDTKQDGTSIGYAIYKTSHLIAASKAFSAKDDSSPYKILSAFLIIITDGLQDPSLLDKGNRLRTMELEEAAAFAKEKNIKVFIVNIEPRINEEQFAPNRRQMERITATTGGRLIIANQLDELQKILLQIPKEELSKIYPDEDFIKTTRVSFYPYFVGFALSLFVLSLILDQTIWRRAL